MTIEQRIYSGHKASEILESEVFQEAFSAIEKEVLEQWINSPARDAEGRERLHSYLMLLRKVKANLVTTLETGKLAQLDLDHKRSWLERAKDAF